MSKRQKFAIATIVLALGILAVRYPFLQWRFRILAFALISWVLSVWALYDSDFSGIEWGTLTIIPAAFSLGTALIYPLLPTGFESFVLWPVAYDTGLILAFGLKILFLLLFAVGYYASLLTENIYNVAAIRTIQLLRAAHSVGFIMALISALYFYLIISSFHLGSFFNFILTTTVSWLLIFPTLWSVNLPEKVRRREVELTVFIGLIIGEIAWVLSFWPVVSAVFTLFLTSIFYVLIGVSQYHLSERLFGTTVREFMTVSAIIFLLIIFTTSWTG